MADTGSMPEKSLSTGALGAVALDHQPRFVRGWRKRRAKETERPLASRQPAGSRNH